MKIKLLTLIIVLPFLACAQIPMSSLLGYFDFNNCEELDSMDVLTSVYDPGVNTNIIRMVGRSNCEEDCGVIGSSMRFDGLQDQLIFFQGFAGKFDRRSFSISFYIKPDFTGTLTNLFSKREDCSEDRAFSIDYNPTSNRVSVLISEEPGKSANVSATLDPGKCWQHITFVKDDNQSLLYINGELRDNNFAPENLNLSSNGTMKFSEPLCADRYSGLLDELAFYDNALTDFQVRQLFFKPDQIINRDTAIFLGDFVDIKTTNSCADAYQWSPNIEVDDDMIADTILRPTETRTYTLEFFSDGCIAEDDITIIVRDPDTLDCTTVYLPNAFTPNNDNLNDIYKINNPRTIDGLISFDILDRWGSRVFATTDPQQGWDGTFQGQNVNPGVFLYRIRFLCKATEQVQSGSLTLIR